MAKKKEKDPTAPTLEEKIKRLETRLREFEERSGKKIKDLENLVEYLTNKVMKWWYDSICKYPLGYSLSGLSLALAVDMSVTSDICPGFQLTNMHGSSREEKEGNQGKIGRMEETVAGFDEKMEVTKGSNWEKYSTKNFNLNSCLSLHLSRNIFSVYKYRSGALWILHLDYEPPPIPSCNPNQMIL